MLQDGHLPVIEWYYDDENFIFVQENAPCHISYETRNWLDGHYISVSQWLPQNPDINIIENIWKWMKLELQKHIENITFRQDHIDALQNIWRKLEVISNRKRVVQTKIIASENKQVQKD